MDTIVFMALPHVRPIEEKHSTVHIVIQFNTPEPKVLCFHEVRLMFADVTRSRSFDPVAIDSSSVKVSREYLAFVLIRPLGSLINHHSAMGVPASRLIGAHGHFLFNAFCGFLANIPMVMIALLVDQSIQSGAKMLAVHSLEIGPGQAMPEVTDYSVDEKELPMFVPIMSPRVGRAFAYNLKFFVFG